MSVYCIIEKGAGRDGRVGASVGSTGQVGAARGFGWLVEDVGPLMYTLKNHVQPRTRARPTFLPASPFELRRRALAIAAASPRA